VLTLPKSLREKYDLEEGDALHLVDAGGTFVLTPMQPMVPSLSVQIEELREETGLSVEELLDRLRNERAALVRERYGDPPTGEEEALGEGDATGEDGHTGGAPPPRDGSRARPDSGDE
jgi:bifunctional DNA-binding transcriptional regulator/antitoxin component of YhaV-PrlF toxin-antitoxin module